MAIRFPSLTYLAGQAWQSLLRFPLTIFSSLAAVCIAIFLIETEDETFNRFPYINAMLCAALGISVYFCVAILARRLRFSRAKTLLAQLLATAVLAGIYFTLPDAVSTHNTALPYIRFGLYAIIAHLLVSFVPFLFSRQLNGFWNYNKALFLRLLAALLYSGFLYVGLVLALFALKVLFDVEIPDELFFELFVVIAGLFNTWFFVAGVPLDFDVLDTITTYPKGLKVFTQYVLLPLLALYLLILYGYGLKIILSWNWPEGIVSYMIMVVSVLGIFAMLLIYPYALQADNQWIRKVSRGYYLLLLPLLVLLFLAIGMRLADYGFTVNRYLILATGIWLAIICVYFLSGRNNIKFIPVSLAALLLLISFGPWGLFSVSKRSQVNRLEAVLRQSDLLQEGQVVREVIWVTDSLPRFYSPQEKQNEGRLNDSLHNEVYSILHYLDDYHGFPAIQPWYAQPLDSLIRVAEADTSRERWQKVGEPEVYMESLGLPHQYKMTDVALNTYFHYSAASAKTLQVRGYDELIFLGQLYHNRTDYGMTGSSDPADYRYKRSLEIGQKSYAIAYSPLESDWLSITTETDSLQFPLGQRIRQLLRRYPNESRVHLPASALRLDTLEEQKAYRLILEELSFITRGDSVRLQGVTGKLLVGEQE